MKSKKIFLTLILSILSIVSLWYFFNSNERDFKLQFKYWDLAMPDTKQSFHFKEKPSFTGDKFEYVVFSNTPLLESEIESYIEENNQLLIIEGDQKDIEYLNNSVFSLTSENQDLINIIDESDYYQFYALEKPGLKRLVIIKTVNKVIYIFISI